MVPELRAPEGFWGRVRATRLQRRQQFTHPGALAGLCRNRACRTENAGVGGSNPPLGTIPPSVPIPKFASLCGALVCELRNQRDTSNFMILVRHLDLKFLNELAAIMIGTSNPPH
jgi:hypothetical protein